MSSKKESQIKLILQQDMTFIPLKKFTEFETLQFKLIFSLFFYNFKSQSEVHKIYLKYYQQFQSKINQLF